MFPGYMIIGALDPIGNPGDFTEIVNNARAFAYADYGGLCWLQDCTNCDPASMVTPGYPFTSPALDPAPWYDPNDPDSAGFLGVVGLDVSGDDSSTRQASVSMGMSGVGIIGPTYMGPRTMIVRALAIATDDCALQYGITWLRQQYAASHTPCGGDALTFFDCCPCVCDDPSQTSDCWATTYGEMATRPACTTIWWPSTYGEMVTGPPQPNDEWCNWVDMYREADTGPPQWTCCLDACVTPYVRQFYNVRVTEGPVVLQQPSLTMDGAVAEIEFTIVAADPAIHAAITRAARAWVAGGIPVVDPPAPAVFVNPYRPQIPREDPTPSFPITRWVRETLPIRRVEEQVLTAIEPRVRVRASERSGPVRLGLWAGEHRVGGYTIPFVAQNSSVVVNGANAYYSTPGGYEPLSAFVRDWDGRWPRALELPHGDYQLTVDQDADQAVRLLVDVAVAPVGSG